MVKGEGMTADVLKQKLLKTYNQFESFSIEPVAFRRPKPEYPNVDFSLFCRSIKEFRVRTDASITKVST
jgi:hypothetical protein